MWPTTKALYTIQQKAYNSTVYQITVKFAVIMK